MAISRAPRAEHHVAAVNGALVHFAQVNSAEVDLEGAFITEGLEANVAFDSLLSGCWICGQLIEDVCV